MRHLTPSVLAIPPCLVALVYAASGTAALITGQPLVWPARPASLSEAMAMRDQGEVTRLAETGVDVDRPYPVRELIRPGATVMATPLDAAIWTRERYLFELGLRNGARLDARNAPRLQCVAEAAQATDIAALLAERFGPPPNCENVELPW